MRILALILAAAAIVATATPAFASGGLPQIADMMAGPYMVMLFNDSPTLVTGRNTLTLELPPDAAESAVQLTLTAAAGREPARTVTLHPVTLLGGAAESMGDMGHSGGHDHAAMAGMEGMDMADMPGMGGSDPMSLLRGSVNLPSSGAWWVRVSLTDPAGQVQTASTQLVAVGRGPNRLYVLVMGTVIAGALVLGFIGRRQALALAGD